MDNRQGKIAGRELMMYRWRTYLLADRRPAYRKQIDQKWTDGVQTHSNQLKITSDRMVNVI